MQLPCSELGEDVRAKGPHHALVQQCLGHLGLQRADLQSKRDGRHIIYNSGPKSVKHTRMRRTRRSISSERSGQRFRG